MIGPSKILTVSYGTFSCTLEGFDDPFSTMRAIAEYFRDLAAEDRYFGATPPTPDAEMLHRIAEREVQRRVEARVDDHGIVLRAGDGPAPVAAPVAAPATLPQTKTSAAALATAAAAAPVTVPVAVPVDLPAEEAEEEPDRPEAVFAEDVLSAPAAREAEAAPADHDSSDVAAKLLRIRAVIAAAQAAKTAPAAPAATVFEDEEEPQSFAPAFADDAAADAPATGPVTGPAAEAGATADDGFGFDLELDDLPGRPAAEAVAEPAAAGAEPEEVAAEAAEDLALPPIEEIAAAEIAPEEAAPEEIAADEVAGEIAPEDVAEEIAGESPEAPDEADEAGEPGVVEDSRADEAEAADATAGEPLEAVDGEMLPDAAMDDEDYAALALATLAGAQAAAGEDAADDDEAMQEEDDALSALDLADWRIEDEEVSEEAREIEAAAEAAAEAAGAEEDLDDEAAEIGDAAPVGPAAGTAPAGERRPGFFERARARVVRIGRGAAPVAETGAEETQDVAEELPADAIEAGATIEAPAAEAAAETGDDADHAAIFAALNGTGDGAAAFEDEPAETDAAPVEDEPAEAATAEADDEAAILAGIGAALDTAEDEDEDEDDEALLGDLSALARDSRREAHEGRAILEDQAGDGEASVERLMEEAKSKLEGVENRRRFSAIAHLKAAVAATVADRKLKSHDVAGDEGAAPVEDIDRYRDDLSKAVRPRRPTTEGAAVTRRPALSDRPAPLVLVSEQRVDIDEADARPSTVIRPRRVGAAALTVTEAEDEIADETPLSPEEAKNFAEFADRLGAASLAELLEAAAAYTATVEGMPHFSRPHILRKVSGYAEEDEFTREDGLRSFGMLLRQGKIQKISRGQFTITEASRFMSEARRVAR